MSTFVNDPQFGSIIDYKHLRQNLRPVYDQVCPDFNLLGSVVASSEVFLDEPSYMVACGASGLAYSMMLAAEEFDLAEQLKDSIFTLGWTEEHTGTDLLSVHTRATPMSDDPDEKNYHVKGGKWLINNSYHADYHMVVAKTEDSDGPRSLSLFLVPHSSTSGWQRLEAHVLTNMVLTKYSIDGPGRLIGKKGHGLSILQRMAMPSKYQCSYFGMRMVREALPAAIEHLSSKRIFSNNPINFSNVFRQLYNLALQGALLNFIYHRAIAFSDSDFLQFHGTMLKSWMLLRANELLSQNLLVAGSKGFLKESVIGRDAIDSFVLPVFDGHYTLNTLMTAKHMDRYLNAAEQGSVEERVAHMRATLYKAIPGGQMSARPADIRKPSFFDYAAYIEALELPIALDARGLVAQMQRLVNDIEAADLSSEAEYKYKLGVLVHWMEALLAACEMWKVLEDDAYLNAVVMQYNGLVRVANEIISEGALPTGFLQPLHQLPLPQVEDPQAFLLGLLDVETRVAGMQPVG